MHITPKEWELWIMTLIRLMMRFLPLLTLTLHDASEFGSRAWKGHDWDALNRLYEKGFIHDPKSKGKSVVVTPEGLKRGKELFEKLFSKDG